MNTTMTKVALALALTMGATAAHAVAVTSLNLSDSLTLAGALGTDGKVGAFKFNNLTSQNAAGASLFLGNVNGGAISLTGANAANSLNPATAFTTGFTFAGSNFGPDTTAATVADITGGVLTFSNLSWGGYYSGASFQFNMTPDAQPVSTVVAIDATTYAYRSAFSHYITAADDPSGTYAGFTAFWIIEGVASTAAPVPEASTYGMMLAGLGLVGAAVRRRRTVI